MLSIQKTSATKEADASVHQMIALLERLEQHESPQSLEQFILGRRLTAGVTDPGYSLSRPSITFSMLLTTRVKRS